MSKEKNKKIARLRKELRDKNREIARLRKELCAAGVLTGGAKDSSQEPTTADMFQGGALPDFIVIGTQKGGTTSLYSLLRRHPLVKRAARKEVHYFDENYDKGIEWYRSQFPLPKHRNERRTITGEASPLYMFHSQAPERAAEVVPEAKLIALLRDPVDRAYSGYHHAVKLGKKLPSFEEVIEQEMTLGNRSYLARGIYVDQIQRWHRFFDREQLLVLKSEDFFEAPRDTLKRVLVFLDLREWEPDGVRVANQGEYTQQMNPKTRERLRKYFEPHNRRLYEYLGRDFGW